jgi:hypothetical protein
MGKLLETETDGRVTPESVSTALNATKLELALAVAICIVVALLAVSLSLSRVMELTVLALIAVVSAAWVILRTRQVVRRLAVAAQEGRNGAQQEQ